MKKVVALPNANARRPNSRSGTIGWDTRFSQATKATRRTAPALSVLTISGLAHPAWLARTSAQEGAHAAAVTHPAPVRGGPPAGPVALRQQPQRRRARGHADRDIDPEDPVPVDALGDRPAHQRPGGHGQPGEAAID